MINMAYRYAPLHKDDSIRLLELSPGHSNAPLEARLITHQLKDNHAYDALSYVWGHVDETKDLIIDVEWLRISRKFAFHHRAAPAS